MGIKDTGKSILKLFDKEDEVFAENETQANKLVASSMLLLCIILIVCIILNNLGIFQNDIDSYNTVISHSIIELFIPFILCCFFKGQKKWLKYFLLLEMTVVFARIDCSLGYNVTLIMAIPVVLSCRYFSSKFTIVIAVVTALLFGLSSFANAYWDMGVFDLNFYSLPAGTVLDSSVSVIEAIKKIGIDVPTRVYQMMVLNYGSKLFVFFIITVICVRIAQTGHDMVLKQRYVTKKSMRIESELNLATNIQAHMLPNIFPAFPDDNEFDLYASMKPAKEVGGDFYDFDKLDDTHLALVIADVSGKGIPAALFMVIAKTIIKNELHMGYSLEQVLSKVNHMLCEGNTDGMFVTAWVGVFDVETGILEYVSAGHNPPCVLQDGNYHLLKSKPGFVLAGLDGVMYHRQSITLSPGDKIFLYTDGVTEAIDKDENMYGDQRLLEYMNAHKDYGPKEMINGVKSDLSNFALGTEQFDDVTMLMMEYKKKKEVVHMKEKEFNLPENTVDDVLKYIETELNAVNCPIKALQQILICTEEIFVNIASYAYANKNGKVLLATSIDENKAVIQFKDSGVPFNPLEMKDPDVTLSAKERDVGGLGIYIVKKVMDEVNYTYQNGCNILTIGKEYKDGCVR